VAKIKTHLPDQIHVRADPQLCQHMQQPEPRQLSPQR
jgi:hypothetical protein